MEYLNKVAGQIRKGIPKNNHETRKGEVKRLRIKNKALKKFHELLMEEKTKRK